VRPSSSHLTTASSSLARSTVPNSPVGFPKLPKPSTRSPGVNSSPVAEGSESGGLLARSESGTAPAYDKGGWGELRSWGTGLLVLWLMNVSFWEARSAHFAATRYPHNGYSIDRERMLGRSKLLSSAISLAKSTLLAIESLKVVQCDQTPSLATSMTLRSGAVRRLLQGSVSCLAQMRYKMSTILIVLVVLFLLGGGGWGYSRWRG